MQQSGIPVTPVASLLGSPEGSAGLTLSQISASQYLLNGGQPYRESVSDRRLASGQCTPSSGVELAVAIVLFGGDVITNLSFVSSSVLTMGSNADGHLWFALRNELGGLILQTADQGGSATWLSGAWKTLALSGGPYTVPETGLYYVSQMQNVGTGGSPATASMRGNATTGVLIGAGNSGQPAGQKAIALTGGSGLGGTAPSSPTLANSGNWLYCVAS